MNKILVTLCIPTLDIEFDSYLPINKKIGTIKKYLLTTIKDYSENQDLEIANISFVNCNTGIEYTNDAIIKNSGMVNGEKVVILII